MGSTYDEMPYEVPVGNLVKVNAQQEKMASTGGSEAQQKHTGICMYVNTHICRAWNSKNSRIRVYTTFFSRRISFIQIVLSGSM